MSYESITKKTHERTGQSNGASRNILIFASEFDSLLITISLLDLSWFSTIDGVMARGSLPPYTASPAFLSIKSEGKEKGLYYHLELALAGMNHGVRFICFGNLQ